MALKRDQKRQVVAEVTELASVAHSVAAAEYRGLSVQEISELRNRARASEVSLRVVKNSLAKRAFEGGRFASMNETLTGPLVLGFSREEPGAVARVFRGFAKENPLLVVRSLSLGGDVLDPSRLSFVADLPTREQALAQLMGVMKAPIEKLARTLAEPPAKLVRTLAAVRDQKQGTA